LTKSVIGLASFELYVLSYFSSIRCMVSNG